MAVADQINVDINQFGVISSEMTERVKLLGLSPKLWHPEIRCRTCLAILNGDKHLYKRLAHCKALTPGGEPLASIARDYQGKIGLNSLTLHCRQHQMVSAKAFNDAKKRHETKKAFEQIELEKDHKEAVTYTNQSEARKALLQKGMEALERGDLKLTMQSIVALLGQEQKAEESAKDRTFELQKMFNYWLAQPGKPQDYLKYTESDDEPTPYLPHNQPIEEGEIL